MINIVLKTIILVIIWNIKLFADMKIEITNGVNSAYPIAVVPFTYTNQNSLLVPSSENIELIISTDLRNSGKFNTVPISYLPYKPTKVSDVIPTFWEKMGINVIVLGTVTVHNNHDYIVTYQLIDTSNNPALVILENQFSIEKKWLRHIAHIISNEIFEKLTGIKGIFCTKIAYVTHNNNIKFPYELCISDYDGYNKIVICRSAEPLMSPAWAPDGKKIAYVTFASGRSELVIQTLDNGLINNIVHFPQHNGAPAFSPDGKKLAFSLSKTGSLNLYIMDLISEEIKQLTHNNNNNTEPSWFPDNENLAYTSDQSGVPQIYKININTFITKRLSWLSTNNQSPNVSPDGTFIIMVNRFQGKQSIAKLDLLTEQEQILTTHTFLDDTPSIAPNNTVMLYSTIKDSMSVLELISIDGKFKAYLKGTTGDIRFPKWEMCL